MFNKTLFSKALMDDNVMARYTTMSTEPRDYVQYDQGEDRWLCTLLLQRGYRVEYCAASDAKTHAPEGWVIYYYILYYILLLLYIILYIIIIYFPHF